MKTSRRTFLSTAAAGSIAAAFPLSGYSEKTGLRSELDSNPRYAILDEIIKKPVLKKELFTNPVIIDSIELLHYNDTYLVRVRSTDGAEGIAVPHGWLSRLIPVFIGRVKPFFIGQDARELDFLLERLLTYRINFRLGGLTLGVPTAALEFAILDMLGHMANKSVGQLCGEIHNTEVPLYVATEFRHLPLEEHFERLKEAVAAYDINAIKMKVGDQHFWTTDPYYVGHHPGKDEKLIPMIREHYGDDWHLYADANGYYSYFDRDGVDEAIRICKIMQENKFGYIEEPVMFDHFLELKMITDALDMPTALGEQEHSFYNLRWLIANDGVDIVQPDHHFFGGMTRSIKLARMAEAFGKQLIPHISGGQLGIVYNAHVVSICPNAGAHHEFKGLDSHVPYECPTSPLNIVNGKMKVPTGPGLGVIIDPDYVNKHEVVQP